MLPSKLFFDNFFDDLEAPKKLDKMMKCDIYEKEGKYNIEMDLPGFKKENINLDYKDGYLKISAVKEENENEDKKYTTEEISAAKGAAWRDQGQQDPDRPDEIRAAAG